MTIHFLPDKYTKATKIVVVIPVSGVDDLTDDNRRWVIPYQVEISLTRFEGTEKGDRFHAYVAVQGPRRLKSGAAGKQIMTASWDKARHIDCRGLVFPRPDWLTSVLVENLPDGWDPALLGLPRSGPPVTPAPTKAEDEER